MQEPRRAKAGRGHWLVSLLVLLVLSAGFAAIDLGVKQVVFSSLRAGETASAIPGLLYFQVAHNTGGLFGIGRQHSGVFILLSSVTMAFVLWMYFSFGVRQWVTKVALGLILGGAVGNFVDRACFHYVRDFLLVRVGTFEWPNFNLADVWITVGAAMLLLWMITHPDAKKAAEKAGRGVDNPQRD